MNLSRFLAPVFAAAVLLTTPGCPAASSGGLTTSEIDPLVELYEIVRQANSEMGVGLPNPDERKAALELRFVGGPPGVHCSGYAVDTHLFVTATHCLSDGAILETLNPIGSEPAPAKILYVVPSDTDQAFVLTDYTFEHYAPLVRMDPALPHQGERVHYWGAPLGIPDQYREGYITGYCALSICFPGLAEYMGIPLDTKTALLDIAGQKGDSGAGLLNEAGELIGIISLVQYEFPAPFVPMAVFPLAFTDEDLAFVELLNDWTPPTPAARYAAGE